MFFSAGHIFAMAVCDIEHDWCSSYAVSSMFAGIRRPDQQLAAAKKVLETVELSPKFRASVENYVQELNVRQVVLELTEPQAPKKPAEPKKKRATAAGL